MAKPRRRIAAASGSSRPDDVRRSLVERRLSLELTQFELADLAGVSRSGLQRLERGGASTNLDTVVRVAEALGCRLALVDATGALLGSDDG